MGKHRRKPPRGVAADQGRAEPLSKAWICKRATPDVAGRGPPATIVGWFTPNSAVARFPRSPAAILIWH